LDDDWERRAFARAVSLAERGLFEWQDFQRELVASVGEAEHDDARHPARGHYESWLISLERVLARKRLLRV
jgi:nitrile hydratase accessory protein